MLVSFGIKDAIQDDNDTTKVVTDVAAIPQTTIMRRSEQRTFGQSSDDNTVVSDANRMLAQLTELNHHQKELSELSHYICTVGWKIFLDTFSQDEQIVAGARHELLFAEQPPDESLRRRHARQRLGRNVIVMVAGVASPAQSFQPFRSESDLRYDADQQVVDLVIQRSRQLDVLATMGRAHVLRFCNERRRDVRYRDI